MKHFEATGLRSQDSVPEVLVQTPSLLECTNSGVAQVSLVTNAVVVEDLEQTHLYPIILKSDQDQG